MEAGEAGVILTRARQGDEDAFRVLVELHARAAFRVAFRLMRDERDAEDVVQESFIRAHRRLPAFEARANFGTWLHRIVVNCALDALRSRDGRGAIRRAEPAELPDTLVFEGPSPERLARSSEIKRRLEESMRTLTDQERVAFTLRHHEGRSIEDIGETLGIQHSAAKHAVFRAVRKLRAALEPLRPSTAARDALSGVEGRREA
jgi:RNA polymerase sigma-70 factor, ECF subfamily